MVWSERFWFVAFFVAMQLGFAGCGPSFPHVRPQADSAFMHKSRAVQTVDILPLDVQLWTYPGNQTAPQDLGASFHALTENAVLAELAGRGYDVIAHVDWDGSYDMYQGRIAQAMTAEELGSTVYALSSYGQAVSQSGDRLITPYLPYRMGQETGSDATLYIGGWAYVGNDSQSSKGKKIAKGVAIGLIAVALVAVIILVIASKSKGSGGHGGGAGHAASGAGRAASAGRAAGRVAVTVGRATGRVTGAALRGVAHHGPDIVRGLSHTGDEFASSGTHIEISNARPNYYKQDQMPKRGSSQMYLEMTLIENATGNVLWHARQQFSANGAKSDSVRKVVSRMLESLPRQ